MKKIFILVSVITVFSVQSFSQQTDSTQIKIPQQKKEHVYNIKPWIDFPVTIVFAGVSVNGMRIIYGREAIPAAEILGLNKESINSFDRPIADNYSTKAKAASDLFFYGSIPLPLFLLFDKKIRKDGPRVGLLFLETLGTTGAIYTTAAMMANRYRPYAYNSNVPMITRQRGGARNSFFAGHPAVVATSTFFMAKVYSDFHPEMKHKWILYALAGTISATTGYLRIQAGQHFTSDVITGIAVGTLVRVLVPHIHKNKNMAISKLTLAPRFENGGSGFSAFYKLGK